MHEEIREVLRKAYQVEVDGHTFYTLAADRATKPAVGELFAKLAADEIEHKGYLASVMGALDERGAAAFAVNRRDPDLKAFTSTIFNDRFRTQARGADFELAALSIGMTLETNAIATFSGAAAGAAEDEVRDFYNFLADWERQHLAALRGLYDGVRQEFWAASGFAPF